MDNKGAKGKQSNKQKRDRAPSGKTTSPSEKQTQKKLRTLEFVDHSDTDSTYDILDAESDNENERKVNEKNMAEQINDNDTEMTIALIKAVKNPSVIKALTDSLRAEIRNSIKQEIQTLTNEIKSKDTKIKLLEGEVGKRDEKIGELEDKIESLEMYGRRNGVRIFGIKESEHENTDEIVIQLAEEMGVDVDSTKLGRSHRVGKKQQGKDRAIIAKFIGHNVKVAYMKGKKNLRDIKHRKNVYINEDLTQKRSGWLLKARTLKRQGKIISCWTADGVLFTKRKVGKHERITRIASDNELDSHIDMVNQEALEAPQSQQPGTSTSGVYALSTDEDQEE